MSSFCSRLHGRIYQPPAAPARLSVRSLFRGLWRLPPDPEADADVNADPSQPQDQDEEDHDEDEDQVSPFPSNLTHFGF